MPVWLSAVACLVTSAGVLGRGPAGRTSAVVQRDQMIALCPSHPSARAYRRGVGQLSATHSHGCFVFPAMH